MEFKTYYAQDSFGNSQPGASVSVFINKTSTLATGLVDKSGNALSNPFSADINGRIEFGAPDGIYDLQFSKDGVAGTVITVQFVDLADYNEAKENLIPLGKQYMTLAAAQADIENIPDGASIYVRSISGDSLADEYVNNSGVLASTGRLMPSQHGIDSRWVEFMTIFNSMFSTSGADGFDVIFKNAIGQYVGGLDSTGAWNFAKIIANAFIATNANIDELKSGKIKLKNGAGITGEIPPGLIIAVMNAYGNAVAGIREDGSLSAGKLEALYAEIGSLVSDISFNGGASTTAKLPPGFDWAILDNYGQAPIGVKSDGTLIAGAISAKVIVADEIKSKSLPAEKSKISKMMADLNHLLGFGQSLICGINSSPLQTTTPITNAYRFNGGVRAQDGAGSSAENHASLTEYIETSAVTGDGTGHETPMGGEITAILDMLEVNASGYSPGDLKFLGSVPGQGSRSISELKQPNGVFMTRLKDDISYGMQRANELGMTYAPLAVSWMQSEADQSAGTPSAVYMNSFSEMVDTVNVHASSVLGKSVKLPWFLYQMNSWMNRTPNNTYPTMPLTLLDLARTRDDTRLVQPMYMYDYADNAHLLGFDSKMCGYRFGIAIEQELITGKKFEPLWSQDKSLQGGVANIWYDPVGKLVLDASLVSNPGNYGISAIDPDGNALTITEVSVHLNRLRVRASGGIPSGSKIRLGFIGGTTGTLPSRTNGPRCCLRDSQGDSIKFDPSGVAYRMDNYAIVEEITL